MGVVVEVVEEEVESEAGIRTKVELSKSTYTAHVLRIVFSLLWLVK